MEKNNVGNIESAFAFFQEKWTDDEQVLQQLLFLKCCGIENCLPGHGYGPARRDCYLIHFVLEGHGFYEYRGERIHLEKGQSFLIYPDENVYYQADLASPWKYCWIGFHGVLAEKAVEEMGFSREYPVCTFPDVETIEKNVAGIIGSGGSGTGNLLRRGEQFLHLIANLLDQGEEQDSVLLPDARGAQMRLGSQAYTARAVHYLENHFREKVRIQRLAQEIGISRSYLTQQFKDTIGMSPRELLINIRMEHAVEYLEKTNDPIQLVALECGYDDALAFSKAFKARFGMSPTRFRRAAQDRRTGEDATE